MIRQKNNIINLIQVFVKSIYPLNLLNSKIPVVLLCIFACSCENKPDLSIQKCDINNPELNTIAVIFTNEVYEINRLYTKKGNINLYFIPILTLEKLDSTIRVTFSFRESRYCKEYIYE